MGTELGNLYVVLCIFILHIYILTYVPPSPPLLTFGARHNDCYGRFVCLVSGSYLGTVPR